MNNNDSRWTDNPFRQPGMPPEQLAWLEKRDEATRIFLETGDDTMAIEIGLFPPHDAEEEAMEEASAKINAAKEMLSTQNE